MANQEHQPRVYGQYQTVRKQDSGGNGVVYLAKDADGVEVAIKAVKRSRGESYQRFEDEIHCLRSLKNMGQTGILQIIEDGETDIERWFSMPYATTIKKALGVHPSPQSVVSAMLPIAETPAKLHAQSIYHRDIKPSNLFLLDDNWLIGDFGLVSFPNKKHLTGVDNSGSSKIRKLGSDHYIAVDMLNDPNHADKPKADVYALAKTLWVLITRLGYPPPGHQATTDPLATMKGWGFVSEGIAQLDWLIDRATETDPTRRPTMLDIATELHAWLNPPARSRHRSDVSDLIPYFEPVMGSKSRESKIETQRIVQVKTLANSFREGINEFADAATRLQFHVTQKEMPHNLCWAEHYGSDLLRDLHLVPNLDTPTKPTPSYLLITTAETPNSDLFVQCVAELDLLADGQLQLLVGYFLRTGRNSQERIWSTCRLVPFGSAQQSNAVTELNVELTDKLHSVFDSVHSRLQANI